MDQFYTLEYKDQSGQRNLYMMNWTCEPVNFILKMVYVPEYGLDFLSLGLWLLIGDLGGFYSLLWDLHDTRNNRQVGVRMVNSWWFKGDGYLHLGWD